MATNQTDSELVHALFSGDQEAFTELYRRRQRDVYRFALHMSGAPDLAEDITQEVFMVLIREANSYDETRGSVKALLLGIARNHVLRRLKQDRPYVMIDDAAGTESSELIDGTMDGGQLDVLTRNEEMVLMERAVLSLPAHYREVLVLCELQEMSYVEAAGVLGCAIGTVRSRLHRARAILIEKLRPAKAESTSAEGLKSARCFA
jgi:RNA polymerase sigma-70 factor (ECF subfamily)